MVYRVCLHLWIVFYLLYWLNCSSIILCLHYTIFLYNMYVYSSLTPTTILISIQVPLPTGVYVSLDVAFLQHSHSEMLQEGRSHRRSVSYVACYLVDCITVLVVDMWVYYNPVFYIILLSLTDWTPIVIYRAGAACEELVGVGPAVYWSLRPGQLHSPQSGACSR